MVDFALVIPGYDYIIVDPTQRKFATYKEIGWDEESILKYLDKKENHEQVASFITNKISFSASSRVNRFYEIYNKIDKLNLETAYKGAIEGIKLLSSHFEIHVLTNITKNVQEDTLNHLNSLNFPLDMFKLYFKNVHESLHAYKRKIMQEITSHYQSGVGIITHPKDGNLFKPYGYSVLGFDTLKDESEFLGYSDFVCHSWNEICHSLEDQ
jgi:hypothetical protein